MMKRQQLAKKVGAELVVIDPLYKLVDGDENSAQDMKPILAITGIGVKCAPTSSGQMEVKSTVSFINLEVTAVAG
jgi:uncharacterized metal-binding protein